MWITRLYRALRWRAQERRSLREVTRGEAVVFDDPADAADWLRE